LWRGDGNGSEVRLYEVSERNGTMLLADFVGNGVAGFFLILAIWGFLIRKFCASNPAITDAAKKAGTEKAISVIAKWLK
jgi:hypothetical protein